jgi:hypothetical protein
VIHRRLPDRATLLGVGAGWHMHLDVLAARAAGKEPAPFWDGWSRLPVESERRMPGCRGAPTTGAARSGPPLHRRVR